jgi:DNA-binding GntR family transcriptional regulator
LADTARALAAPAVDPDEAEWRKVRPRTLVAQAADSIIAAVARGLILPGDRIIEQDLADALGTSRVPVREALRLLESQGLVVSKPYKGMRLMPLTRARVDEVSEVRLALETTAARRAMVLGRNDGRALRALQRAIDELELMATRGDRYGLASADTAFHRELCGLAGNQVLCTVWESIALQMTIIIGLSTLGKSMHGIVDEHRSLLDVFARGDAAALDRAIEEHVRVQTDAVDFERLIAERREMRQRSAPEKQAS